MVGCLAVFGCVAASASSILGSAQNFAVLGHETVTNTGPTSIYGNVGVSPGTSITDAVEITLKQPGSSIHLNDGVAQQALIDEIAAYNSLSSLTSTGILLDQLGGLSQPVYAGVYNFASTAHLTGTLTLDAQNDPNARFVFRIPDTLTLASSSVVVVVNGGSNNSIFWQVGSSATLGTSSVFAGNILALASVTLNTNASILCGRAFAQTGAVTLDTNVISADCNSYSPNNGLGARSDFGSLGFSGVAAVPNSPEPGTLWLFGGVFVLGVTFQSAQNFRKTRRAV
jgi:type VI secretion system secreted protein VgrG